MQICAFIELLDDLVLSIDALLHNSAKNSNFFKLKFGIIKKMGNNNENMFIF